MRLGRALLAVGSVLLLTAPQAGAEGRPTRFHIDPSVAFATVLDDNIFLEDSGRNRSIGVWVTPRLELGYRRPALELGADVGVNIQRYAGYFDSRGEELVHATGYAEIGLWRGLSLRVSDAYVPQPERLGYPGDEGPNLIQTNRAEVELRYWRELPAAREISIGLMATHFMSEDFIERAPTGPGGSVVVDDDFHADFLGGSAYVEVQSTLGEQSSGYVRGQLGYRSFDDSPGSDLTDFTMVMGLRSQPLENLELEVVGGGGMIAFSDFGEAPRILATASMRYRFESGWSWRVVLDHLTSAGLVGQEVLESTGRIGVVKRFNRRTEVALDFFITRFDDEDWSTGANLFGGAEIEFRRQLSARTQVSLAYRHWRNAGSFGFDDFNQNRLALSLSYRR